MLRLGMICALALVPVAAQAKVVIDIRATEGQQSRMFSGTEGVTSSAESSIVGVMEDREPTKKRATLLFLTLNKGEAPYNFGPENVAVTANGQSFAVLTYDQLVSEERNKAKWRRVAGAFAAGANSTAAQNSGYSNGTFSAYGNNGASVHGNYNSYDSGQAYQNQAIANRENQEMMTNIRENEAARLAALGNNMQTSTVDPGKSFGGRVAIELPKDLRRVKVATPATITVRVGADVHRFDAMIVPR